MNKMFLKKVLLSVLIVSIVAFGLTGCYMDSSEIDFTKVYLHIISTYSDHHYNIYVDDELRASNVTDGVTYIGKVSNNEDHIFKVIHHKGPSFGSATESVFIDSDDDEEDVYFSITF